MPGERSFHPPDDYEVNLTLPLVIVAFSIPSKVFNLCRHNHRSDGNLTIQWFKGHRGANTAGASWDIPSTTGEGANNPLSAMSSDKRNTSPLLFLLTS